MKIKSVRAFTLVEILVGISIISIMAIGMSQINLNRLSDRQKLDIELSKVSSLVEETRNNALIGRGVGTNLVTPDSWNIRVRNDTSSGTLDILYNSGGTNINYKNYTIQKPFSIMEISCKNIDGVSTGTGSDILIGYTGATVGIDSGCSPNSSILDIQVGNPNFYKNIHIETVTNIIEVK